MATTSIEQFVFDMENGHMPPPINNRLRRLNNVIEKWEAKIANNEIDQTEIVFKCTPPRLGRQHAQRFDCISDNATNEGADPVFRHTFSG